MVTSESGQRQPQVTLNDTMIQLISNGNHLAVAEHLLKEYHFATMRDTEEMYMYQDGVYITYGSTFVQERCRSILGDKFSTHKVNEIINSIKYATYVERQDFDSNKLVLNVKNGLLNLETLELQEHSPEYLSLVRVPITYNPNAECPRIEQFFSEVLMEEDIPLVEEMVGFCLLPEYRYHKAFLLQGAGRNGKSTLLNLIIRFLGERNCSSVDLVSLCNERFASSQLYGKLANIFSDLPSEALKSTGIFKTLVGQDRINAERKFQHSFEFYNYAKLIFSCNYVPMTPDLSQAFYARWIIIRFPHTFEGEQVNPNLIDVLTTQEELSGLLNIAIKGLKRVQENGFSYNRTSDEIEEEYQRLSNPVSAFIADCVQQEPEGYVVKDELYNSFRDYCKRKNYPIFSEKKFTEWLKKELTVTEYRPTVDRQQKRAWRGIKLLPRPAPSLS